ncbi:MAG: winged helix-turn-helix domain-containing protein [Cyclobacteriaceae bacterium]
MSPRFLIVLGLAAISVFLISAGSIITQPGKVAFPEKQIAIALRNVGHQLMIHAGDSVSRILPVKKIDETSFRLEFVSPFTFVPDSLVGIVQKSLATTPISLSYTVNVLDCFSHEIVYGFQIGEKEQTTLVPCLGRTQPLGCYVVLISFLPDSTLAKTDKSYLFALALFSLVVVAFVGRTYVLRKKILPTVETGAILVGTYEFYEEKRLLKLNKTITELSAKESQLLKIFVANKNELVSRSQLMKEVWNDDGALVSRSLDVFVSRLRKKLKDDPGIQIMNAHGLGYTLTA